MQTSWALREGGLSRNTPPPRAPVNHPTAAPPRRTRYHDDRQGCAGVSQETPRSGPQQQGAEDQSALARPPTPTLP